MIFKGETLEEYRAKSSALVAKWRREDASKLEQIKEQWKVECQWHPWFAWYPVEIEWGTTAWLQTVERRLKYLDFPRIMASWQIRQYIYRLPPSHSEPRTDAASKPQEEK